MRYRFGINHYFFQVIIARPGGIRISNPQYRVINQTHGQTVQLRPHGPVRLGPGNYPGGAPPRPGGVIQHTYPQPPQQQRYPGPPVGVRHIAPIAVTPGGGEQHWRQVQMHGRVVRYPPGQPQQQHHQPQVQQQGQGVVQYQQQPHDNSQQPKGSIIIMLYTPSDKS